jgi:hypothetical protein
LAAFNATNEPHLYEDQQHLKKRAVEFAQQGWLDHLSHMKTDCPPKAFECAYVDGFADYLLKGGNGAPPTIPPPYLRRYQYLSPDGHSEMEEYYSGFAAGAADAKASGQRVYFTVPVSSLLPKADKLLEHATEEPIREVLPLPKLEADGGMTRLPPELPPGVAVSSPRLADAPPTPLVTVQQPQLLDKGPEHPALPPLPLASTQPAPPVTAQQPQFLDKAAEQPALPPLPLGNSTTQPAPVGPANTARDQPEQALPREFMLPILGGAGSR